ncbi:triphosphoribosyl-dephospho-CoA synthase [Geomonas sp. RF6]|uniref:triphosphoribosyl-dephospho-CoA synthase n=1 Tax=Geomonas sp. RF6 TaxID=2897342 RepID=UPI001E40C46C|nr:triphosphoribosyl-dephospho-CoA synthase [Geomonas sp. RF6]UFS71983.1 triphosphoribosyl-dephospho-CoA synthase [Geomonas sp. RF6]
MPSLMHCESQRLAQNLLRGAFLELYLTPKPGLVDLADSGSHKDLSVSRMEESLTIISGYLTEMERSLDAGEDLEDQITLGIATEHAVMQQVGTNCHRGFIFLSGLLLSASRLAPGRDERALSGAVASLALQLFARTSDHKSNGSRARKLYQVGGIKAEALRGLPSLFNEALPAYRAEIAAEGNRGSATFAMLARLMQTVEDTTALHRCGTVGLARLREDGRMLERLIAERDDFMTFLTNLNRRYMQMNLTMGGVADLLALAFAWLSHTGELDLATRGDSKVHTTPIWPTPCTATF